MSKLKTQISNEKNIVSKILAGDEQALVAFYHLYQKQLFYFIKKQLGDYQLAEEIAQDTFLDFIEAIRDFRFGSSLKTYLFSIARNKVIDTIRKKKLKQVLFSSLPSFMVEALNIVYLDDELEQKELAEHIKKVLASLPNEYQLVLRLKYVEGEKVMSIAEKMSMTFKATESLIWRARKAFKESFNQLKIVI